MKRTILLIIITIASIFIGFVFGAAVENKFDILSTNKEVKEVVKEYNAVENQYFNMIKDKHDRKLVKKAYNFLEYNEKRFIDYSIKSEVSKVDNPYGNHFFPDDYYVISFRAYGIFLHNNLIKNTMPYDIAVGIDVKTEKIIKILPTD